MKTKIRPVEQYLKDTDGFYLARVTMYRQDYRTGKRSEIVDTYEGYIKDIECGIIYKIRPQASMRSRFKTEICTVSQRLISIEKLEDKS